MVRMHHEKKVSEHLDKMGIENFVPVQQEFHQMERPSQAGHLRLAS
ncbi:transcriptional regulator [Bacteroides sp. 1_1_14]|nr:transcriptional regulator [Bacteroides sp. 1_1_14]